MRCATCTVENPENATFCLECEKPVGSGPVSPAPAPSAVAVAIEVPEAEFLPPKTLWNAVVGPQLPAAGGTYEALSTAASGVVACQTESRVDALRGRRGNRPATSTAPGSLRGSFVGSRALRSGSTARVERKRKRCV
jgi:hypothetical protein